MKNGWWGPPLLPEILGQTGPAVPSETPIFNRFSFVTSQP